MSDLPIIMTSAGAQPTPPKNLLATLTEKVSQKVPGYTANLPPGLITDLASTATGAVALIDQARVDLINSVSPYGANIPLLRELGNTYGVQQGTETNTSVYVVFSGLPGFLIPKGFTVSDGNNQYSVVRTTVIPASGKSAPVWCLAASDGSWAVPAGSVTQIITSVPSSMRLSVTNPDAGLPGVEAERYSEYRARVMDAGMFAVQGTSPALKTALGEVEGVQTRLISFRQISDGKWAVIVGGGESYEVAHAIFRAIPDISRLTADVTDSGDRAPEKENITLTDFPDTYTIPFLRPYAQDVTIVLSWNTTGSNYVDPTGVSVLAVPTIAEYINGITVGMAVNLYHLQSVFKDAVSSIISPENLSLIKISVAIDGVMVAPEENSGLIYGGRYGYFITDESHVVVKHYDGTD
ncbi:baseplate J/gp47 family protein [Citrobacter sedlakii]|uniref:baseplate J/gp47 family protein n=1 Tax=Citrobacter sedlakii TaxID=67826 RepID=UPI0022B41E12|nr:baseplate J/gp47 family protein [Citrobacter sedlakii]MCZ4676003.1 baseplate J/gp47 family protein [Citrobacter sedlakii]MDR5006058.1 baseplate J/gp47 family protein [Citrobacter sedlakii]